MFPEHFWTEFDADRTNDFWTGEEDADYLADGCSYWENAVRLPLSADPPEEGLRYRILHIRPLLSTPLRELLPGSTLYRVYACRRDPFHFPVEVQALVVGPRFPRYVLSDATAAALLSERKVPVASEQEARRRLQAFLDLRRYGLLRSDIERSQDEPPLTPRDLEPSFDADATGWTVRCILICGSQLFRTPAARYELRINRDGTVSVVPKEVVRHEPGRL